MGPWGQRRGERGLRELGYKFYFGDLILFLR